MARAAVAAGDVAPDGFHEPLGSIAGRIHCRLDGDRAPTVFVGHFDGTGDPETANLDLPLFNEGGEEVFNRFGGEGVVLGRVRRKQRVDVGRKRRVDLLCDLPVDNGDGTASRIRDLEAVVQVCLSSPFRVLFVGFAACCQAVLERAVLDGDGQAYFACRRVCGQDVAEQYDGEAFEGCLGV